MSSDLDRRHRLYLKIGGKSSERISWMIGRLTQSELEQNFNVVRYKEGTYVLPRGIAGAPTLVYFSGDGTTKKFEMEECGDTVNKIVTKIIETRQKTMHAGQPPRAAPPVPQQQFTESHDGRRRERTMQYDSKTQQLDSRTMPQQQDPRSMLQQQDTSHQDFVPQGDHRTVGSAGTEYVAPPIPAGRTVDSMPGSRGVIFDDSLFRASILGKADGMHMFGTGIS